ncbi:hypothetical protein T310_6168 [Rasamsonia emersonii CBS 393.64]|uniref:DEAD box helicase involved in nonsense mediated decay n=1 Tax=Rasamsonia emersonii (strain ATCC 16479 / CBS 393.64 / IMI 116815) TaxID=1408163 RepID=A0A0F4YNM6_RASE3|nr:hypothetical protein T310_6168 [Rasamsonia emersonii CBS 393.64]KKA19844.1 hypothetical protein T310_6168 [Rasamsonia emersonii CBS 393.64]
MAHLQRDEQPRGRYRSRGVAVPVANKDIRKYVLESYSAADEGWTSKPEIPASDEVMGMSGDAEDEDVIPLMPNQIAGPWPSREAYLSAHYELLREESLAPLRDAVAYVRENPLMMDSKEVCIYEKVHIIGVTFAPKGVAARLQFSTARAGKNIVWEYSRRLMSGSIVALSPVQDHFKSKCVVAVVAARPLEQVKQQPHQVDIFFARVEDAQFDVQQEWIMVEPRTGYYESVRYTMTALQRMTNERFPLVEHICNLKATIDAPEYVKENPVVDLSPVLGSDAPCNNIDVLSDWPEPPSDGLDASQWEALRQILTKRLAIVQGPPGTGKTHVSVAALKVLLSNMKVGDPPIIIAAQTNHALDQLINHVSLFEKNYVRLGGRSADPEIRKRTLFEIRQKNPTPSLSGGLLAPARKDLQNHIESITKLLQPFKAENSSSPLPASFFLEYGVLTPAQCDSLREGAKGWIGSGLGHTEDPMATWLGDGLVKFDVVYKEESFGFEEEDIDLEYEQLKELEAERGFEDDLEALKGFHMPLKEGFVGQSSPSTSEKVILETHLKRRDLWQIPAKIRGAVYNVLCKLAKGKVLEAYQRLLRCYEKSSVELQIGKWERDLVTLQGAKLIGMTTTGLSKYRTLVSCLKPRIIMIEEAAEVIEAPVVVSCVESLQHLILVGDHKQLQGHCHVRDLEGEPFFLNVSMFERLVHNGIEFKSLTMQRRMAPEIRRLLTPIYENLTDHSSVEKYPKVPGMGDIRSFFFCHTWPESSDSLASKYNPNEAQMIVGFFLHLVFNGIPVSDITILTFYNGQRKKLLKLLKDNRYLQGQYVKVVTVDSYQGEENEVVILSLVRSSEENQIGFLSVENRVCVAMSRARRGLYIFGNGQALAHADPLWWQIIKIMGNDDNDRRRLGFHLPLTCGKHGKTTFVQVKENKPNPAPIVLSEKLRDDAKHARFIQSYKDFANGGAKKHDALLAEKANALALEEMQKHLDQEAWKDLFGDEPAEEEVETKPMLAVTDSPVGKGGTRERYVNYFNPDTSPKSRATDDRPVVSLLDDGE